MSKTDEELKEGRNGLTFREDRRHNCQNRFVGNIPEEKRILSDSCDWIEFDKG
jgi:hypothetical protein